ncbi:MAG: biopolymer transporter ExbD [Bacteriovoracaceae bacterium]|nr:biopolymer transporter ExbD [Bacteriovoracaceae bacterium]
MAMGPQNSDQQKDYLAEINVTPMVDVMLVLLVIFMISAPFLFNGIPLKLPISKKVEQVKLSDDLVVLSIGMGPTFYLGKVAIPEKKLMAVIMDKLKVAKKKVLYLRGDGQLKYEVVVKVMGELKRGGVENISLITEYEK